MNAPDQTGPPPRRSPLGRGAYLWLIGRVPDQYEPRLRDAATTVRHRRLRIRLFRERSIRRSRRAVRRSERSWRRRGRRMLRILRKTTRSPVKRTRQSRQAALQSQRQRGGRHDESFNERERQLAEQLAWTPRSRIARAVFPATVRFPGEGEFVAIDATGHPTADIIACQHRLPHRVLVVTDAPTVGALRTAGIPYEYVPAASAQHRAETFFERLLWLDYVYGIDRIERLDHYGERFPDDSDHRTIHVDGAV